MQHDGSTRLGLSADEVLTTTRTVRKRLDLDRPVPLAVIRDALDVALQAPTGGHSQGWHWIVVTDPEVKAAIAQYYRRAYADYAESIRRARSGAGPEQQTDVPPQLRPRSIGSIWSIGQRARHWAEAVRRHRSAHLPDLPGPSDLPSAPETSERTQARVAVSSHHLAQVLHRVPALVIGAVEVPGELPTDNQASVWGSLLPAAWSLALALRERGIGTAWTTMHLTFEKEIGELLGIPPHIRQGVLLPVAYTRGTEFRAAPRRPLDEVLHLDRW